MRNPRLHLIFCMLLDTHMENGKNVDPYYMLQTRMHVLSRTYVCMHMGMFVCRCVYVMYITILHVSTLQI